MATRRQADAYVALIRERYIALESIAQQKEEAGEGAHEVVILYLSPTGERIAVVGNIFIDERSHTLIIEGEDNLDNLCEVIAYPESVHFVLSVIPLSSGEQPRQKPGFIHE